MRSRPIDFRQANAPKPCPKGQIEINSQDKIQSLSDAPDSDQAESPGTHHNQQPDDGHEDSEGVSFRNVSVVGGGAWGTALALTAERAGCNTAIWVREPHVVEAINRTRRNPFLRDFELPASIRVSDRLPVVLAESRLVLLVVPSQFLRATARYIEQDLPAGVPVVICSKGVERGTGKLMTEIVAEEMPGRPRAVLSGPSFAKEVAAGQPTAVTIAVDCESPESLSRRDNLATRIALTLGSTAFRPYVSDDPIGVEVGGAVKNVIAIACGMAAGKGLGSNPRAALITRGLAEIKRLAMALGGRAETVTGLAGIGDLALTCSDEQSRNFSFGKSIGLGVMAAEPQKDNGPAETTSPVVEGAVNARAVVELARALDVEMPICELVDAVVNAGVPLDVAMEDLLTRPIRAEVRAVESVVRMPHPAVTEREPVEVLA